MIPYAPKGGEQVRGNPIITLRLERATINALRKCADMHEMTVSDLIRKLIDEQLKRDGITPTVETIDGQISM